MLQNEKRKKEGNKPKNSQDFQNTLSSKEVEQVQLCAIKTKVDEFARRDLGNDPRKVYETSAKDCWDNLKAEKAENRPRCVESMSEMLEARKICSTSH